MEVLGIPTRARLRFRLVAEARPDGVPDLVAARLPRPDGVAVDLPLAAATRDAGGGDEVIVPNMTFVATINAVILTGATPVIADVNEDLNISSKSVINSITKKTKAILPVHFAGKMCDMNVLTKIARTEFERARQHLVQIRRR